VMRSSATTSPSLVPQILERLRIVMASLITDRPSCLNAAVSQHPGTREPLKSPD
jgi:hypothetical protein